MEAAYMINAASRGDATLNVQHRSGHRLTGAWVSVLVPETANTVGGVAFSVTADGSVNDVIATNAFSGDSAL